MKKNNKGFAHLELLMVTGVVVLIGLAGWFVLQNRNKNTKQENQVTKTTPAPKKTTQTTVKLDEKDVAELAQTTTKTTPVPSKSTTSPSTSTSTTTQTTTTTAPTTTTVPSYSITISSDGCSVSGYSVAGNKIEIGAFSNTKGGSVVYDITSNDTITKSSGGFKGMTAFGRTTDAQGNVLAYHSAPITADSCPPAGN